MSSQEIKALLKVITLQKVFSGFSRKYPARRIKVTADKDELSSARHAKRSAIIKEFVIAVRGLFIAVLATKEAVVEPSKNTVS